MTFVAFFLSCFWFTVLILILVGFLVMMVMLLGVVDLLHVYENLLMYKMESVKLVCI